MTASSPRLLSALPVLVVPDVPAAVTYYRDLLGFSVPPQFQGAEEFAIVDLRPGQGVQLKRGSVARPWRRQMAVYVLLGLAELERLAARVAAEGANVVSPLRDQPWGMRELSLLDSAGYLLRFGSDADSPSGTARVWPDVPVTNALEAAAFCRDRLGMGPAPAADDSPYFQRSHRDDVTLHWWVGSSSPFAPTLLAPRNRVRGEIWDVAIEVRGVDALAAELIARGAEIQRGPETTDYGIRELEVAGPEGCTICFGEDLGAE